MNYSVSAGIHKQWFRIAGQVLKLFKEFWSD